MAPWLQGQQTFPIKGWAVSILGFVSHMVSVITLQLYLKQP